MLSLYGSILIARGEQRRTVPSVLPYYLIGFYRYQLTSYTSIARHDRRDWLLLLYCLFFTFKTKLFYSLVGFRLFKLQHLLESKRSEPSSRTILIGEQPNPWDLLQPRDMVSRHRGAELRRRYGRLGGTSLLPPE